MRNTLPATLAIVLVSLTPLAGQAQITPHDSGLLTDAIPTQPTYGSELRRGAKAAIECQEINGFEVPDKRLSDCYEEAMHLNTIANAQNGLTFDLGVFTTAFSTELIKFNSRVAIDVREHSDIKDRVEYYFVQLVTVRKELGLTDEEVISSLGMSSSVLTDIRRYETHPELLAPHWKEP